MIISKEEEERVIWQKYEKALIITLTDYTTKNGVGDHDDYDDDDDNDPSTYIHFCRIVIT